jgi:hypothetical protein
LIADLRCGFAFSRRRSRDPNSLDDAGARVVRPATERMVEKRCSVRRVVNGNLVNVITPCTGDSVAPRPWISRYYARPAYAVHGSSHRSSRFISPAALGSAADIGAPYLLTPLMLPVSRTSSPSRRNHADFAATIHVKWDGTVHHSVEVLRRRPRTPVRRDPIDIAPLS